MSQGIKRFTYNASDGGACCTEIRVALRGEVIEHVEIIDGCDGNHRGIQSLVKGRKAQEIIKLLRGTPCGNKDTSCPDQLAQALQVALKA